MKNIISLINKLLRKVKHLIGYREFSTEYDHLKFISKYIDFLSVDEIYLEFFGFLYQKNKEQENIESEIDTMLPIANDLLDLKKYYKLELESKNKKEYFTIQEGELLAVYTVKLNNEKIYQYIKRYYQNYHIIIGNFTEIYQIPTLNFNRKLIYKNLYFYDCLSINTIKNVDKVYYKDV